MKAYLEPPPPNCQPVSLGQLKTADEWIFTELTNHTRMGLTASGSKTFPCDQEFLRLLSLPGFTVRLAHSPGRQTHDEGPPRKAQKKFSREAAQTTSAPPPAAGKGKSKSRVPASMPSELSMHCHKTTK
eukprot:6479567-Amphidinium_carterae.1